MELAATKTRLSPRAQEDYKLVQSAIDGNQLSYAMLMERYRKPVYHTIIKMVNNSNDADDLTLEAFGKAFTKLKSYAPHYAFSTWLFKIAKNNCIDHIRKKRIQLLSIDEPIEANSPNDFSNNLKANIRTPEEEIIRTQRLGMVQDMITHLSYKYRMMIKLRYYEELSYEEIATELEIPLGTVKAQLFRAKELLFGLMIKPGPSAYLESTKRRK